MLDASCHFFFTLRPLVTSLVSFSKMALPTTDLNSVDCHFPIQHGTPHVGCFLSFVFYFADPLLLPPSTHPPFHSFHTRHAPPRHRLLLFVVAAGFRSLFSGYPARFGKVPRKRFPSKVSNQGFQARCASKVPRKRFPKVCKQGYQARLPSKVPKQGSQARFPSQLSKQVPKQGSQARFPSKVSKAAFQAGFQARFPSQLSMQVPKQGSQPRFQQGSQARFPSKVPKAGFQARCPSRVWKGSQEEIPKQGFQARWPKVFKQCSHQQVPKQGSQARPPKIPRNQEQLSRQGFERFPARG